MAKSSTAVTVGPYLAAAAKLEKEKQLLHESIVSALSQCTPGWSDVKTETVDVRSIGGAMTNLIFTVSKPEGENDDVLVRIYGEGTESFFSRSDEIRLFQLLSEKNIGVALLGEFANGRVEKFIDGKTFSSKDMRKPELVTAVAKKMRQFHEIEIDIERDPRCVSEIYHLLKVAREKCVGPKFDGVIDLDQYERDIKELEKLLEQVPSKLTLCHNDLQYGNIMKVGDSVVLIDFEYSSYNPRGFDLGNHFCEWAYDYHKTINPHLGDFTKYPTVEQQQLFCRAYLAGDSNEPVSDEAVEQLRLEANTYGQASHLFWGLWGYIQASQSEIDFDFLAYGQCRYDAFKSRETNLGGSLAAVAAPMDDLNQFLNNVEASARRILKQQNKKQQEQLARDRVALAHGKAPSNSTSSGQGNSSGSPTKAASRDELRATYGSGGTLIIDAPVSPTTPGPQSPSRRSESESDPAVSSNGSVLPRIVQPLTNTNEPFRPMGGTSFAGGSAAAFASASPLPTIDKKKAQANKAQQALEAAKKINREKRVSSSLKLLDSPLYKSLQKAKPDPGFGGNHSDLAAVPSGGNNNAESTTKSIKKAIRDVDNVSLLLKKMGLRHAASPTRRPDHAVEKRMCNACWAEPTKLTGCEHHARMMPHGHSVDPAVVLRALELQGPTSWLSDDLFVKYRSEKNREQLWLAYLRLKEEQMELEQRGESDAHVDARLKVLPLVTRHPIYAKHYTQIDLENLRTLAATRKRNLAKTFIFDVNHIWLTNLDHFNTRLLTLKQILGADGTEADGGDGSAGHDEDADNPMSLRDRRDEAAIHQGYSQIPSISSARALQNAIFPEIDPLQASYSLHRQISRSKGISVNTGASALPNAAPTATSPTAARRKRVTKPPFYPLTLLVCGHWKPTSNGEKDTLELVPGVAIIGKSHALWWAYEHDNGVDYTKAVAMYARGQKLSSSNAILVTMSLALDAPILSPLWFAWHVGSKTPPPVLEQSLMVQAFPTHPPRLMVFAFQALLQAPLQTRLDALLPCTLLVLNGIAGPEDHVLGLDEPYGHRRFCPEHIKDAFRQWWLINDAVPPNYDVELQPCSVQVAQPNSTGVCGRFIWHSSDVMDQQLCRRRLEKDFMYMVQNRKPNGANDPLYFSVSMRHEVMLAVSAARLSSWLAILAERQRIKDYEAKLLEIEQKIEAGRLVLEAKRDEQQRLEKELAGADAKRTNELTGSDGKLPEPTLQEWQARLKQSVVKSEQGDWQQREIKADGADVVFYYSLNEALPTNHRFVWEKPMGWQDESEEEKEEKDEMNAEAADGALTSRSTSSSGSSVSSRSSLSDISTQRDASKQEIARIAAALLEDQQFLAMLREKLGVHVAAAKALGEPKSLHGPGDQAGGTGNDEDNDDAAQIDLRDQMILLTEEQDHAKASMMAAKMAKLQLAPHNPKTKPVVPGEGWKRLKATQLPRNFARLVYSEHTEGPRSAFINQTNQSTPVGMIDPGESSEYDQPEFVPELRAQFIPRPSADLQERKLLWAEAERARLAALGGEHAAKAAQSAKDALFEKDPREAEMTLEQQTNKAVLCARNNNLEGLEAALDDGVDVNARDQHGNTLFILVCQQGNKRLAKFLMRRHADMNLQNMNGNTALHYLHEYKHIELADYLKSKGANDMVQNSAGLTCYEGLSTDELAAI
ncbi:TPA: hypothetical protein N0F65_012747 [Lagenidium giganteum]|uniref:Choline kinase n=1 Tax=Lagenidium giganteum TaxID=4803 RepID=A0AAV2YGG8_9STRA|nr:TPA: hypothetical protein N0F65_012747 [Lagenidium giganteum]